MAQINHIGISGGKDSTALLLWAVYESGYPRESLDVTFCDTGNEHPLTMEHIRLLSDQVYPIHTIKPERDFWELAKWKKRFPGAKSRFCTQFLKMIPTQAHVLEAINAGHTVLMHSGVRASESDDRKLLDEREPAHLSYFGTEIYRPLLRWTIDDVWAIHARYGIPPNPLYAMGARRVGCFPCIMSRKREIALCAQILPEKIDFIRERESDMENPCGYSSLFPADKAAMRFRTKTITAKPRLLPDSTDARLLDVERTPVARSMQVATIDDVVRWAQNSPDIYMDEIVFEEDAPTCDTRYGACE